jgi:hypothetical protein
MEFRSSNLWEGWRILALVSDIAILKTSEAVSMSKLGRHVATFRAFLGFAHEALTPMLDQGCPHFELRRPGQLRRKARRGAY